MEQPTCTVRECGKPIFSKRTSLCSMHYYRHMRHGTLSDPRPSREERFWAKVNKTETCWEWTGTKIRFGYGMIRWDGRMRLAHRVSYLLEHGSIDPELAIDHICHKKSCVKPSHLRPATLSQNQENYLGEASTNTSGFRGVSWYPRNQTWRVQVSSKGRKYHVGYFDRLADAAAAAKSKRLELHTYNDADRS